MTIAFAQDDRVMLPTASEVDDFIARLGCDEGAATDHDRIELLAALERLKGAAAAAQARVTFAFDRSQRAAQADLGVPASERGRGVASQGRKSGTGIGRAMA